MGARKRKKHAKKRASGNIEKAVCPLHVRPLVGHIFRHKPRITTLHFNKLYQRERGCHIFEKLGICDRFKGTADFFYACDDFIICGGLWSLRAHLSTGAPNASPGPAMHHAGISTSSQSYDLSSLVAASMHSGASTPSSSPNGAADAAVTSPADDMPDGVDAPSSASSSAPPNVPAPATEKHQPTDADVVTADCGSTLIPSMPRPRNHAVSVSADSGFPLAAFSLTAHRMSNRVDSHAQQLVVRSGGPQIRQAQKPAITEMSETSEQPKKHKLDGVEDGTSKKKVRIEELMKDVDVEMKFSEDAETKSASYVDHTNLKQGDTLADIRKLCEHAQRFSVASVCVHPIWVKDCVELLKDSSVDVCTVIGFPLGANVTAVKKFEAEQAVKDGAVELDMVISVSKVKGGDFDYVKKDIEAVREAIGKSLKLKAILETSLLTDEEVTTVSNIVAEAGADFVKTSTGSSKLGAVPPSIARA